MAHIGVVDRSRSISLRLFKLCAKHILDYGETYLVYLVITFGENIFTSAIFLIRH